MELCVFELRDESRWKAMSEDAVRSVSDLSSGSGWPALPPLCPSLLDVSLISNEMEQELRILISEHRRVRRHEAGDVQLTFIQGISDVIFVM